MPSNIMNKPYQRAELVLRWVAGEMSVSAMEKSVAAKACGKGSYPDEIDELLVFRGSLCALVQTQEGCRKPWDERTLLFANAVIPRGQERLGKSLVA